MTSTKHKDPTKTPSIAPYKAALKRLEEMQGQMGAQLFDRIQVAVTVFEDAEFRAQTGNVDDSRAARFLDGFFPELFFDHPFDDLRAILKHFPKRARWEKGDLRTMWKAVLDHQSKRPAQQTTITRRVISQAEYADLMTKYRRLERENAELKAENEALKTRLLAHESQRSPELAGMS